ncbi:DNA adenine methylase [Nautilia lithotrophica]
MLFNDIETKKDFFLTSLRSKNSTKNKYKRYGGAPIRYPGGKSLAVGYILELLPSNVEKVISPFIGGGSVEIAISKELEIPVIGYDIFDILVNFWQVLLNPDLKEKMLNILYELTPNRETYHKVKEELKKHWQWSQYKKGSEDNLIQDKVKLAAYYYFNYNLSYGPGFLGWPSSVYLNEKRYFTLLEKLKSFENDKLEVYCSDFRDVLKKHQNDFLYLDPPYYIGEDSKMFKGIYPMRNFPVHHNGFPHEVLRDMLKEHKGGFVLSYNDCPTIREYYNDFEQYFPSWQYTMGQGEKRIGKYRKERECNTNIKESHEILIYCPPKQ